MTLKSAIAILLLLLSLAVYSQYDSKGSYCIGAIGKDGIILAADSREMLYNVKDPLKTPVCYYDSNQKVFKVNRFGLAFIGNSNVGNFYLRAIINDYKLSDFSKARGDSIIFHFLNFCKKEMRNDSVYESFIQNIKIMSIGYENGRPFVCWYDDSSPAGYIKNPKSSLSSAWPSYFYPVYSNTLSCLELAKKAEKSIYEYAEKENHKDIIGGEIMVLQIKNDNSYHWLLHSPKYARKWITLDDFEKDYKMKKIKLVPAKNRNQQDIINLISY